MQIQWLIDWLKHRYESSDVGLLKSTETVVIVLALNGLGMRKLLHLALGCIMRTRLRWEKDRTLINRLLKDIMRYKLPDALIKNEPETRACVER